MGYRTLETVLAAGRDCVDISFFPEDSLALDALARQRGARAIADCGVMPGLGGMLALRMARELEAEGAAPQRMSIMVGGLPQERRWPLEYKAPFSPSDVLEEYVRPARLRRDGRLVELPALSEPELIDFPGVGTLEAFNTDGLRTLLSTLDIPDMAEKTLRYPGHRDRLAFLSALGFFDSVPVRVRAAEVAPVELTAALLERVWRLGPGEPEFTAMRVEVEAEGRLRRCDLLDRTDPATGDSSMARTTGWPAVLAVRLLLAGGWDRPGVTAPELLAADDAAWRCMLDGLAAAGIELLFSEP
jgi:lysine 6-dehydrogenase